MDFKNQNDKSLSNILSRKSSVGCSSRISYYRSGEGVPFKWEMQPGVAKEPQKEELPPLTPPPALLSRGLPKPCIPDPKPSTRSRLRFWKKRVERGKSKKPQDCFNEDAIDFDILARLDCSSDSESMASPRGSSFSSSSSMSFTKSRPLLQSACSESPIREVYGTPLTLGCFPMRFSRVLVSIARRY
ncbi:uncharacterized protein LOC133305435 [Gastrolobium bilobum]|uniref:uncharacterized protein LOC133305435 n=1 Tax=Gastrolobium bilobum TaxID=150636 RepID=UPI002AAF6D0C|nr:uncharacterized protein LOC133305435 [Gastrolobium bilobum]